MTEGRKFLNCRTRQGHTRVEQAFDVFDMGTADGMVSILTAHINAMDRLLPGLASRPEYRAEVSRLRSLAESSRAALDLPGKEGHNRPSASYHPLAIAYVVLGSRLGARLLAHRLDQQATQWSEPVRRYFTDRGSGKAWAQLCSELDAETCDAQLGEIAADAQRVFDLYREEATALASSPQLRCA